MATGWLGGTFDPIHLGHLDVARAAQRALSLDYVTLGPTACPAHRVAPVASAPHRFAMTALAVEHEPGLRLSDLDMRPDAPAYTWDLLDRLEVSGVDLRTVMFVTGADAFRDIRSWRRYPALLDRCHFVVVSRPGYGVTRLKADLPEWAARMHDAPCAVPSEPGIFLVDMPTAPVASTDIRRALSEGRSVDGLVPASVAVYLTRQGLYRTAAVPPGFTQDTA